MKFPLNALSLVLATIAGAGAGGAVAYQQFAGAPSARVEAPSATTTAPTVQAEPTAPAPAPQGPPATSAEAPKAQPSGQAPSLTSQPQAAQSGGADVVELQKQVANHEQRIEELEKDVQTANNDTQANDAAKSPGNAAPQNTAPQNGDEKVNETNTKLIVKEMPTAPPKAVEGGGQVGK